MYPNLETKWSDIHTDYRKYYSDLHPEDLTYHPGEFEFLLQRIAKRTLRSTGEVKEEIQCWTMSL